MKKIALVNQRYGAEVNGGSEYYTRKLAEKLSQYFDVEVITTKALLYDTWADYYDDDIEVVNGVVVRRFSVKRERNVLLRKISGKILSRGNYGFNWLNNIWIKSQGPYSPDLIDFIRKNSGVYDFFIFVTYLYYPVVMGLPVVKDKAIFIPTAHDEFCIYFNIYKKLFYLPKGIIYLTEEEKAFVQDTFHNEQVPSIVAGMGVDLPEDIEPARFREKYKVEGEYLIYVGRVDINKGCKEMIDYFLRAKREDINKKNLRLVILGQAYMKIPEEADIKYLGFVSEQDKYDAISGAKALLLPSRFESLSISVLEAMALGKPVIVNGKCDVLKGHCVKSNGGFWYEDYMSYIECLGKLEGEVYEGACRNAVEYIKKNYSWDTIIDKIRCLLKNVRMIDDKSGER